MLVFAIIMSLLGQFTSIDLMIQDYYFDESLLQFPWQNTWFANDFMHGYVKQVITNIGHLLVIIVLLDLVYPWRVIAPWLLLRLRFIAIAALLIPAIVSVGKHFSSLHCPWDIDRYGGYAPFVRLFDAMPIGVKVGHCFPAGHATVGLWLAALCVFWLPNKPKMAFMVFLMGLSVGFALGWVQQMRGAHFLFHTLWSVWLAAFVIVALFSLTKPLHKTI